MSFTFDKETIERISSVLGTDAERSGDSWSWKLTDPNNPKPLVCSLYNKVGINNKEMTMLSVQTRHGYYEIHNITNYMIFEPDEVIFISSEGSKISCLILGKEGSCSLYSNIEKDLLNADFADLDPALLLSAMQLSITENVSGQETM
jgi:hypothetical protein